MKKVLARCLVLALALCLVCSSCLAETGYETIKAYLNGTDAGTSLDATGYDLDTSVNVIMSFSFEKERILLSGENAQGKSELTVWNPSTYSFLQMLTGCLGKWDDFSAALSDGHELLIGIELEDQDDPVLVFDAEHAKQLYEALSDI